MYSDEQFEQLEQEELIITDETIAAILLILATTKGNLENELRRFYQEYGKDGVVTYAEARKWISSQNHQRRLTALSLYISGEFLTAQADIKKEFETLLKRVIAKETGFFNVEVDLNVLLTMRWGVDDANWLKRLEDDVDLWIAYIGSDLRRGLLQKKQLDDVLIQLDKRFGTIEYVVRTLGLSESTAVGSLARQQIFKELGVSKYQFYTKPDERRCEVCGEMHGTIFPMSAFEVGVTASPIHPRCRCWEVPIWD